MKDENNLEIKSLLEANTQNGQAFDIQSTDELLHNGQTSAYLGTNSLQSDLFPTLPLRGPSGYFINVRRKDINNNKEFELIRNIAQTFDSEPEKTGLTKELLEDLINTYGKENQTKIMNSLIHSIVTDNVNDRVQTFLDTNQFQLPVLPVSDVEKIVFQIVNRQGEVIHASNEKIYQGSKYFVLVPSKYSSQFEILGLFGKVEAPKVEYSNLLWETQKIVFIHNPNPGVESIYVGLRDTENVNRSQAAYSPYVSEVRSQVDYDTGNVNYHVFNRYQLTMNPIQDKSLKERAMLWKFNIQM